MSKMMGKAFLQLCLVLVLLSSEHYVNIDRIDYINVKEKWIKVGHDAYMAHSYWYLKVTDKDIQNLKDAMGVYVTKE